MSAARFEAVPLQTSRPAGIPAGRLRSEKAFADGRIVPCRREKTRPPLQNSLRFKIRRDRKNEPMKISRETGRERYSSASGTGPSEMER